MKTIVVMPAYNAEATLERTIEDIPYEFVDEILITDDASQDSTVLTAKLIGANNPNLKIIDSKVKDQEDKVLLMVLQHHENKGYGANQKTCYRAALDRKADIIVMLHPDYQYDPKLVKYFVEFIKDGYFDVMLGSRIRSRCEALAGGMPRYKYYANRALTLFQNLVTGRSLSEWHTGMRAYRKEVLESIPFESFSDDFIFDTQTLLAVAELNYSIGDIPVPVKYFKEASSINFKRSLRYGLLTVYETFTFALRNSSFIRYLAAGSLAAFSNLALYVILLYETNIPYTFAAFIAFCCGGLVSFTLHKLWTFKNKNLSTAPHEFVKYWIFTGLNGLINSSILLLLVTWIGIKPQIANILSIAVVSVWGYFMLKHLTFNRRSLSRIKLSSNI